MNPEAGEKNSAHQHLHDLNELAAGVHAEGRKISAGLHFHERERALLLQQLDEARKRELAICNERDAIRREAQNREQKLRDDARARECELQKHISALLEWKMQA